MRYGYTPQLAELLERHPAKARSILEVVKPVSSDIIQSATDWARLDSSVTGVAILDEGGIRLVGSDQTHYEQTTIKAGADLTALAQPSGDSVAAAYVVWSADMRDVWVTNATARLDPNVSGGAQQVATWKAQLFRVSQIFVRSAVYWDLQPISAVAEATAGSSTADVSFTFHQARIGAPAIYSNATHPGAETNYEAKAITVMLVWGLKSDGSTASNVAWICDADNATHTDGNGKGGAYVLTHPSTEPTEELRGTRYARGNPTAGAPVLSLSGSTYTEEVATIEDDPLDLGQAPESSTVLEVVVDYAAPGDSSVTVELDDGAAGYTAVVDGDRIGEDRSGVGGTDLSGFARQQVPYNVRITLTPSTDTLITPVVYRVGVREIGSEYIYDLVKFGDVTWAVDPTTMKSEVPEIQVEILRDGARDYRSLAEDLLAGYNVGDLLLRVWLGHPTALYRQYWLHIEDFIVKGHTPKDASVVLRCQSPLEGTLRQIPPRGASTRSVITYSGATIKAVRDDLLEGEIGVDARYLGPGNEDTTPTLSRTIKATVDGIDVLRQVDFIGRGATISSQGRLKFMKFFDGRAPLGGTPMEEGTVVGAEPGLDRRILAYSVRYGYDDPSAEGHGTFAGEAKATAPDAAITNMGITALVEPEEAPQEVAKWVEDQADAADLAKSQVEAFFAGVPQLRFKQTIPTPWLECGDGWALEQDVWVGRDPVTGNEIRGRLWAPGRITQQHNLLGTEYTLWVRGWLATVVTDADVTYSGYKEPGVRELSYYFDTAGDLLVTCRGSDAGAVKVAASDGGVPSDATVDAQGLQTLDANGLVQVNLGGGFASTVYLKAQAYEFADGSGAASDYVASSKFKVVYIEAGGGTIGGWEIGSTTVEAASGNFTLDSSAEQLLVGAASAPGTGAGVFLGLYGGAYQLRVGDPAADNMLWDGTNLTITGEVTATSGSIGGWTIATGSLSSGSVTLDAANERILLGAASAPMTGVGVFIGNDGSGNFDFRAGDPGGDYIHWDGSTTTLEISGTVTATAGAIGGWTINATNLKASNLTIDSSAPSIALGSATGPSTGVGVWMGYSGGAWQLRMGNPAGDYFLWDGSNLTLAGSIIYADNFAGDASIGWQALVRRAITGARNLLFNAGFEDGDDFWVLNTSGGTNQVETNASNAYFGNNYLEIVTAASTSSNPSAVAGDDQGNTRYFPVREGDVVAYGGYVNRTAGTKAARVTLDAADKDQAHVEYDNTGNYSGSGWVKMEGSYTVPAGVCYVRLKPEVYDAADASATTARFDALWLKVLVQAGDILADTITANEVGSLAFTGKTATFDTGSVGGWSMSSSVLKAPASSPVFILDASNKKMQVGSSASAITPTSGTGIYLGYDGSSAYVFRAGDPNAHQVYWDGDTLNLYGVLDQYTLQDDGVTWRSLAKGHQSGTGVQDGDSVTFPTSYNDPPVVLLFGGLTYDPVSGDWSPSYSSSAEQGKELVAENVTVSGFDVRAKLVQKGASTARTDTFTGSDLTAVSDSDSVNLDNAPASGNTYHVNYDVDLQAGPGKTVTMVIAVDSNDGSGWTERYTKSYFADDTGISITGEVITVTVSGLDNTDDMRIRIKSVTESGGGPGSPTIDVNQTSVTYTTSSDNEADATPSGYEARWEAWEAG